MFDSHQHLWKVARGDYGWMGEPVASLLRDFLPADLAPLMARAGVTRTILVQAAETEAETDFLLGLARDTGFVAGVVGWLDMDDNAFPERLDHYWREPKWLGLRPMLQDLPDDAFILRPRVLKHLALVAEAGVAFDVLGFTRHLPHVRDARWPARPGFARWSITCPSPRSRLAGSTHGASGSRPSRLFRTCPASCPAW